jgi:hypothetical protein
VVRILPVALALALEIVSFILSGVDAVLFLYQQTTVWEDNAGALKLATTEPGRMTPKSK